MRDLLNKYIDKKLKNYGYLKVKDDKYAVAYEKFIKKYNYTHHIELMHKRSGNHLIFSYDKECEKTENNNYINGTVGMEYPIAKLLVLRSLFTF